MSTSNGDENDWGSRRTFLSAMLSQTLGMTTHLYLPHLAVAKGALGHVILLLVTYCVIGIPLLYMEVVVGQFTGRDCLEVWRARACLSHIGYLQIAYQIMLAVYLHAVNSFVVHYFLLSFENPVPYYVCGKWSKPDCNILNVNLTVNQDCLKSDPPMPYCSDLCHSFPEYQYWRFNLLGLDKNKFYLPWRVGLASGLLAIALFISCSKRIISLKSVLSFVTIYPISAHFLFLLGSMMQKGVVVKYEAALDSDFSVFTQKSSVSNTIAEVLYTLNVGTGIAFNSASRASFRASCYSNTIIVIFITCFVTILGICCTAMVTCPYAYNYDIKPGSVLKFPITSSFEKIPRLLHAYEMKTFWLILCYSFIAVSSASLSICIFSNLLEVLTKRYSKVAESPSFVTFVMTITLFIGSAPLLSNLSLYYFIDIRSTLSVLALVLLILENIVFVLWYGLDRFSEDVHFMQGVQPNAYVKTCWLVSFVVLVYVFCTEFYQMYTLRNMSMGYKVGWCVFLLAIVPTALVTVVRLLISLFKRNIYEEISLDSTWGPRSELLRRSRTMFTAKAMTKEYMYRQYHLQAGILKRQKRSNVRMCARLGSFKV